MPTVLDLWNKAATLPQGKRLFSFAFTRKAPYFASIHPRFVDIRSNYAELVIPKRRRVHNHLKTVHAIALCNGLEAAMGALAEATIPRDKRWIPNGMEVAYTAKADSDIRALPKPTPHSGPATTRTSQSGFVVYDGTGRS